MSIQVMGASMFANAALGWAASKIFNSPAVDLAISSSFKFVKAWQFLPMINGAYRSYRVGNYAGVAGNVLNAGIAGGMLAVEAYVGSWFTIGLIGLSVGSALYSGIKEYYNE